MRRPGSGEVVLRVLIYLSCVLALAVLILGREEYQWLLAAGYALVGMCCSLSGSDFSLRSEQPPIKVGRYPTKYPSLLFSASLL